LSALGRLGNSIINFENDDWKSKIKGLKNIDWNKTNENWNGRALINGRASKSDICIALTTNYIKQELNIPLNKKEQIKENKLLQKDKK
jgi:DNA sulfur modification protein DndB